VPVSLVKAPPLDLREAPQPLELERLHRPVELGVVLLDAGIGKLRDRLCAQRIHGRPELAHLDPTFLEHVFVS
jgi:hypothetical protein